MSQSSSDGADRRTPEPAPTALPERFRSVRVLGQGRQKTVYLADDLTLGRRVAVAALELSALGSSASERLHEARAMARIGDHPNVVSIHDVIEGPDHLYIVSPYLPGGDLASVLARREGRGLPLPQAVRIASQICRGLEGAHACGIVHRDLSPGNVFLDAEGNAYLGDFGFSRPSKPGGDVEVVGTPAYMAPEQVSGKASEKSDLYSLGCLLYELLSGRPPFGGETAADTLNLQQLATPEPLERHDPSIPAALRDLTLQLLQKQPEARPASGRDVRTALEGLLNAGLSEIPRARVEPQPRDGSWPEERSTSRRVWRRELALVERGAELHAFDQALARAAGGDPGLVLIPGEAGIGKSRLLREMRARADARGAIAVQGQGYQDVQLPYRVFVEALQPLAGRISELEPRDAQSLRRFLYLDHWAEHDGTDHDRDIDRHRLFVSLFSALRTFCRSRPLVLILDDLHWADSASLDLFEHLAFATAQSSGDLALLLIAGFRPVDPEHRLGRVARRLRQEGRCEALELGGLDTSGIYSMLGQLGIGRPSDQLIRTVERATQGNPLFVGELLEHLDRQNALQERHGFTVTQASGADLDLPGSVTGAIAERTRALEPECREILTLAAFLGTRVELETLASVAERSPTRILGLLDEAVDQHLLVDEGRSYRFAHPLIQQVLYGEPSPTQRQLHHLHIASRLEAIHADDPDSAVVEIAYHLIRAGGWAASERVVHFAGRSAEQALARFAWEEAAELLEAAIEQGRDLLSGAELGELHRKAARAYHRRLDPAPCKDHFDAAIELFERAGEKTALARALGDKAHAAVQLGLIEYGGPGEVARLDAAIQELGDLDLSLRARLMGILAEAHWSARNSERAETMAQEALALARQVENDGLCAELSIVLALVQIDHLRCDEALSSLQTGVVHARRADALLDEEACLSRIPLLLCAKGRLDEAEKSALRALERPGKDTSLVLATLVGIAASRGDGDAAERYAHEALELIRTARFPWSGAIALAALACSRALRDDWAGGNAAIDTMLEPGLLFENPEPFAVAIQPMRRLIDSYVGEPVDSEGLAATVEALSGIEQLDHYTLPILCQQVELCAAAGFAEIGDAIPGGLAVAASRGVVFAPGWPFLVPRLQAVAAALRRRWEESESFFEQALAAARSARALPELARSQLDYARMLVGRSGPGDRPRAARLLAEARPGLERHCPTAFAEQAEKLAGLLSGDVD